MSERSEIEALDEDMTVFEQTVGGARAVLNEFESQMQVMQGSISETGKEVSGLSKGLSSGLRKSFESLAFDGKALGGVMEGRAQSRVKSAHRSAVQPVMGQFSDGLANGVKNMVAGLLPFQNGASFSQGRVTPFANGGVVSGPVTFPMRGGTGLMGEAGPEAIMPLQRGADGKLGVRAAPGGQGGGVNVVMNISTPDAESFRRSQSQVAAQMSRVLSRGQRNR